MKKRKMDLDQIFIKEFKKRRVELKKKLLFVIFLFEIREGVIYESVVFLQIGSIFNDKFEIILFFLE